MIRARHVGGVFSVTGEESTLSQELVPGKSHNHPGLGRPTRGRTRDENGMCPMHARQVLGTRRITLVNTGEAASPIFGSPVRLHGTVTPRPVFLAARARDTMDKARETVRLAILINLYLLEVKNTQVQIQMLILFKERERG